MSTAIGEAYRRERAKGHALGVADAIRVIYGIRGTSQAAQLARSNAVAEIIITYPEAADFVPVGSRPGEQRSEAQARTEYREGEVYYWRPGNYGQADCSWRVPR